ncbi:hypothetical protein ACFSQQ_40225 [Mesorhizobium kowhaii]|uniref:hypothetical protein n=1 Tax=Mesorhizobium kowhaii TaxID=1300272 RepID=UPI0035E946AF
MDRRTFERFLVVDAGDRVDALLASTNTGNRACLRTRLLVEHPFADAGDCSSAPSAGRARGKVKIGVGNFAYNLKRLPGGRVV